MQISDLPTLFYSALRLPPRDLLAFLLPANLPTRLRQLHTPSSLLAFLNIDALAAPPLTSPAALLTQRVLPNLARFHLYYLAVVGLLLAHAVLTNWALLLAVVLGLKGGRRLFSLAEAHAGHGQHNYHTIGMHYLAFPGRQVGVGALWTALGCVVLVLVWWASPIAMLAGSLSKGFMLVVLHVLFMGGSMPLRQAEGEEDGPRVYAGAEMVEAYHRAQREQQPPLRGQDRDEYQTQATSFEAQTLYGSHGACPYTSEELEASGWVHAKMV